MARGERRAGGRDISRGLARVRGSLLPFGLVAVVVGCAGGTGPQGPQAITCTVARPECDMEALQNGAIVCTDWELEAVQGDPITATTCYDPSKDGTMMQKCAADFCSLSQSRDGFNDVADNAKCSITKASAAPFSGTGVCSVEGGATRLAEVIYTTRFRQCIPNATDPEVCDSLNIVPNSATMCFQTSEPILPSIFIFPAGTLDQDGDVDILSVALDSPKCNPVGIGLETSELVYSATPGVVATASGAGLTAPISATGGVVAVRQNCSDDVLGCLPTSLDQLRINVSNMTVAGAALSNVVISNAVPAPVVTTFNSEGPPTFSLASGSLNLVLDGELNGARTLLPIANSAPLPLVATSAGFNLAGSLAIDNLDASGKPLMITVATNVSGTPANAQQLACAGESGIQRLLGFEDVVSWSSTQATLSPVTTPVTQGCGALGIAGQGYMTIASAPFATSAVTPEPALSVDLFIPGNQPNQFYLGALQMYLTCPSANVFNAYIGQDGAHGEAAERVLDVPLPAPVERRQHAATEAVGLLAQPGAEREPDRPDLDPRQPALHALVGEARRVTSRPRRAETSWSTHRQSG